MSARWVFEAYIKGCFDNIRHDWILKNIPINKTILKKWLKSGYGNKNQWWIYHRYFHDNHFTDQRTTPKGTQQYRLYRIAYVPIQYHVKVKAKANPFLKEYDKYFYQRAKWREDLAKECQQITTFMSSKVSNNSRVVLRQDSLISA